MQTVPDQTAVHKITECYEAHRVQIYQKGIPAPFSIPNKAQSLSSGNKTLSIGSASDHSATDNSMGIHRFQEARNTKSSNKLTTCTGLLEHRHEIQLQHITFMQDITKSAEINHPMT